MDKREDGVTKRVRIPVIIDANGRWAASGFSSCMHDGDAEPDWDLLDECADPENPLVHPKKYMVVVDLPVPEAPAIEEVEGGLE